jgi:porin
MITKSDVIGFGASWGRPSDQTLREQEAIELFYRLQVSPDNQLTVGYQAIINPASNKSQDLIGIFELRWRLSL